MLKLVEVKDVVNKKVVPNLESPLSSYMVTPVMIWSTSSSSRSPINCSRKSPYFSTKYRSSKEKKCVRSKPRSLIRLDVGS